MSTVPYTYSRALELEGRHHDDAGAWLVTVKRIEIGEGYPSYDDLESQLEVREGVRAPRTPRVHRSKLIRNRSTYYRRLHNAEECTRFLRFPNDGVAVSLDLFSGWIAPHDGVIPLPSEGERSLGSHVVSILGYKSQDRMFIFPNSWGEPWGHIGYGQFSYGYLDNYAFECYGVYRSPNFIQYKESKEDGYRVVSWLTLDEAGHKVRGFEIKDQKIDDRMGWAFIVERDGYLEVEDLYVRPEFRKLGLGRKLAHRVSELIDKTEKKARILIPFADCRQENPTNHAALVATVRNLGFVFHSCPTRRAAYYASNEEFDTGSPEPIEPEKIPQRPRTSLQDLILAATPTTFTSIPETLSGDLDRKDNRNRSRNGDHQPIHESDPQADSHDLDRLPFQEEPIQNDWEIAPPLESDEWLDMNERRIRLIQKKNRAELTEAERIEFEHLQKIVYESVNRAFPLPPIDPKGAMNLEHNSRADEGNANE